MLILSYIIGFIIGLFFFKILNEMFDIYYFGFKGMIATFGSCWFAGVLITYFFGWLAIIILPIYLIVKAIKGKSTSENSNDGTQEEEI